MSQAGYKLIDLSFRQIHRFFRDAARIFAAQQQIRLSTAAAAAYVRKLNIHARRF
ncbi:hypothetical protein [Mesorhizobium sp. Root157]|uniref:hypothetical protein n=1 Tax=Mesorhizobium sp. Root157 TaxID=1736477 RepID=UPI000B33EAE9|nr:hypothetical protein [Mesorhizobium sp. Root157]